MRPRELLILRSPSDTTPCTYHGVQLPKLTSQLTSRKENALHPIFAPYKKIFSRILVNMFLPTLQISYFEACVLVPQY